MLWFTIAIISLTSLLPSLIVLFKKLSKKEKLSYLNFYQVQLMELENDLQQGIISSQNHQQTQLEIYRRLLKRDQLFKNTSQSSFPSLKNRPIVIGLICIPLAAIILYLLGGKPDLPAQPFAIRVAEQEQTCTKLLPLIQTLKVKLYQLNSTDPKREKGLILLGNAEINCGNLKEAIWAWHQALQQQFDPALALQLIKLQIQLEGYISQDSIKLLHQASQKRSKATSEKYK